MAIDHAAPAVHVPAELVVDRRRVITWLAAIAVALNVPNALGIALGADTDATRYWLLAMERNPSTWFSALLLALTAVATWVLGRTRPAERHGWRVVAFALGFMSLDEVATFHERMRVIPGVPGIGTRAWAGAGLLLAILVGVHLIGWARQLALPVCAALVGGGLLFVLGAVGFEVLSGEWAEAHGTDTVHWVLATIEEDLEILGVLVVLRAVLAELAQAQTGVHALIR